MRRLGCLSVLRWTAERASRVWVASNSDVLIAELDGVRCVVKIDAPGFENDLTTRISAALLNARVVDELVGSDDERRVAAFMDMAWCSLEAEGGAASVPVDQELCDSVHRLLKEVALLRQTLGETARREADARAQIQRMSN